jgi:hypothetical protein
LVALYAFNHGWIQDRWQWITWFGDWFLLTLALSAVAIAINQTFTKGKA